MEPIAQVFDTSITASAATGSVSFNSSTGVLTLTSGTFDKNTINWTGSPIGGKDNVKKIVANSGVTFTGSFDWVFANLTNCTEIDFSKVNTSAVTDMYCMFYGCSSLKTLTLSSNFKTSNVTRMNGMFRECSSLISIDLSSFDTKNVTNMEGMFCCCNSLTSIDVSGFNTDKVTDMRNMFDSCSLIRTLDVSHFNTSSVKYGVNLDGTHAGMQNMFMGCSSLESLDLSSFDTSNVTDMESMFNGCSALKSLDLSSFDTSNVTTMRYMFRRCSSLEDLKLGTNFKTGNVKNMQNMFVYCYALKSVDFSTFDTKNVENMMGMFFQCTSLTELDLSSFSTQNLTTTRSMFNGCTKLERVVFDKTKFTASKVTSMAGMFYNCSSLTDVDVSGFDTRKLKETSNGDGTVNMFYGCSSLQSLNLSSFTLMSDGILGNTNSLKTITAPNTLNITTNHQLPNDDTFLYKGWAKEGDSDKKIVSGTASCAELEKGATYVRVPYIQIADAEITLDKDTYVLTKGETVSPVVTVKLNGEIVNSENYSLTYYYNDENMNPLESSPQRAGLCYVEVSGNKDKGYSGTVTKYYNIVIDYTHFDAKDPTCEENGNIEYWAGSNGFYYTGTESNKIPTDWSQIVINKIGHDWGDPTFEWSDNNAKCMAEFVCLNDNLHVERVSLTVTSERIEPDYDKDGKIIYTATGTFEGKKITATEEVKLERLQKTDINTCKAALSAESFVYNGKSQKPSITVTDPNKDNEVLVENTSYTVEFSDDTVNKGTVTVTITGKYDYEGTITKTYTIEPKSIKNAEINVKSTEIMLGAQVEDLEVTLDGFDSPLVLDKDYTVSYSTDTLGNTDLVITGKDNFKDTAKITLHVVDEITENMITVAEESYIYDTTAHEPEVTVVYKGNTLTKDTDYTVEYKNNTNAGEAAVTVKGKGNFIGEHEFKFNIAQADIKDAELTLSQDVYEYNGEEKKPGVTLQLEGFGELVQGTEYTVEYENNTEVGKEATVIVTGTGNFKGTVEKTFEITKIPLSKGHIQLDQSSFVYTGNAHTPGVTVYVYGSQINSATDYDVEYSNNINAGTATVTITGKGNYEGTITQNFTINQKSIGTGTAASNESVVYYTGNPQTPGVTVELDGTILTPEIDYTVTYVNNTDVGTAFVLVVGIGNYTGSLMTNFKIDRDPSIIANDNVEVEFEEEYIYSGEEYKPEVKVTAYDGTVLKENEDYTVTYKDNLNAGTAAVIVSAVDGGSFKGEVVKTFTIKRFNIWNCEVNDVALSYSGEVQKPSVTVTNGSQTLEEGKDYTVTYSEANGENWKDPGAYKIQVAGINNYEGTNVAVVSIGMTDLANADNIRILDDEIIYDGKKQEPKVKIEFNDFTSDLAEGVDYELSYSENVNAGTATVTIKGIGSCYGTITKDFEIQAKSIENVALTLSENSYVYDGNAKEPDVTVTLDGFDTLEKDKDYTVSYTNNTDNGTATVTVTGIGNFTGTAETTFTISAISLENQALSIEKIASIVYTGSAIEPEIVVKDGDKVLVKDTDYTAAYSENVNAGEATVTVTGKNHYSGTLTAKFTIEKADFSKAELTLSQESYEYDGNAKEPTVTVTLDGYDNLTYDVTYANNTEVGSEAAVTVEGTGNFEGTVTKTFEITAIPFTKVSVEDIDDQVYTGEEIKPGAVVTYNGETLIEGTDYTVEYTDNLNVGTAAAAITGIGHFRGETVKNFKISQRSIKSGKAEVEGSVAYTGAARTPKIKVTVNGIVLDETKDYTVNYLNNVDIGKATVLVRGKGNYNGTLTTAFDIVYDPYVITTDNVKLDLGDEEYVVYKGSAYTPDVTVTMKDGTVLTEGTDYTVEYLDNENAGTATVKITATDESEYSGEVIKTFTIAKMDILDCTIETVGNLEYNGAVQKPVVIIKNGDATLTEDTDYSIKYVESTDPGKYYVKVTGQGNYTESFSVSYYIDKADITKAAVSIDDMTYDGNAKEPEVTVTLDSFAEPLVKGTDYEIEYANNVNAGTAEVTITGIGNFEGMLSESFTIKPIELTSELVKLAQESYTLDKDNPTASVELVTELKEGEDFILTGDTEVSKFGTYTAVVTGKGNYTGTLDLAWKAVVAQESSIVIRGTSISLGDSIKFNVYSLIPDEYYNDDLKVIVELKGESRTAPIEFTKDDLESTSNGYRFTVDLPVKEIGNAILVKYMSGDELISVYSDDGTVWYDDGVYKTSVIKYCDRAQAKGSTDEIKYLAKVLKNYGYHARSYFLEREPSLEDAAEEIELNENEIMDLSYITAETLSQYKREESGAAKGITLAGLTLSLKSETKLNVYFNLAKGYSMDDYDVEVTDSQGNNVADKDISQTSASRFGVTINGIKGRDLDKDYYVKVTNKTTNETYTLKASSLSYAYSALESGSNAKLCDTVRSMYVYNQAAHAYFERG